MHDEQKVALLKGLSDFLMPPSCGVTSHDSHPGFPISEPHTPAVLPRAPLEPQEGELLGSIYTPKSQVSQA